MSNIGKVVGEETAKQTVIYLFGVLALITAGLLVSNTGPDEWKTLKMGTALDVKKFCQREADRWQRWADNAATYYNREKL